MDRKITAGTTSLIQRVFVRDTSNTTKIAGLTGLAYNTASFQGKYWRAGAASGTLMTSGNGGLVTATVGTYVSGGWVEIDATNMPGWYEFHVPNAAIAAGASSVSFTFRGATNMEEVVFKFELDAINYQPTAAPWDGAGNLKAAQAFNNTAQTAKYPVTLNAADVTGNLPADLQKWLGVVPAILDGGGTVQANVLLVNGSTNAATGLQSLTEFYFLNSYLPAWLQYVSNGIGDPVAVGSGLGALNDVLIGSGGYVYAKGPAGAALAKPGDAMTLTAAYDAAKTAASQTSVNNLNNLSALANLFGPPVLEIPDAGTTQYPFTLVIRDSEGNLKDLDANPALTATNAAGTDRSANLSAVTHPSTGVYLFTYGVAAGAAKEGLRIVATGNAGGVARRAETNPAVADYDSITTLASILAKVNAIDTKTTNLPADPASETSATNNKAAVLAAVGNPMQAGTAVTLAGAQPNYAPAKAGDAMTLTAAYDAAKSAAGQGSVDTITNRLGVPAVTLAADVAAAKASADAAARPGAMMDLVNAPNANALLAIGQAVDTRLSSTHPGNWSATGSGGGSGGVAGPGSDKVTLTIKRTGTEIAIPDAAVWLSSDPAGIDVVAGTKYTDDDGNVSFLLFDGDDYYLWMRKKGEQDILGELFTAEAD